MCHLSESGTPQARHRYIVWAAPRRPAHWEVARKPPSPILLCLACPKSADGHAPLVHRGPIEPPQREAPRRKQRRPAGIRCKAAPANPGLVLLAGEPEQRTAPSALAQTLKSLSF